MRKTIAFLFFIGLLGFFLSSLGSLVPDPNAREAIKPPAEGGDFIRPANRRPGQGVIVWQRRDRAEREMEMLDEDLRDLAAVRKGLNR